MKRSGDSPQYPIRGFTLLEVLVVLFVGTILFILVTGAMIGTMRNSENHLSRTTRSLTARLILEQMTRDIESAFAYRSPETGQIVFEGTDQTFDQGASDRLTLVRVRLGAKVPTELEKVTYEVREVETKSGSHQIVVSKRTPLVGASGEPRERPLGLSDPRTQFKMNLEYLNDRDQNPVWKSSWNGAVEGLPSAVKIQLEAVDSRFKNQLQLETRVNVHCQTIRGATS